jgi:hypothetical protein
VRLGPPLFHAVGPGQLDRQLEVAVVARVPPGERRGLLQGLDGPVGADQFLFDGGQPPPGRDAVADGAQGIGVLDGPLEIGAGLADGAQLPDRLAGPGGVAEGCLVGVWGAQTRT